MGMKIRYKRLCRNVVLLLLFILGACFLKRGNEKRIVSVKEKEISKDVTTNQEIDAAGNTGETETKEQDGEDAIKTADTENDNEIEKMLSDMTIEEKVAQMYVLFLDTFMGEEQVTSVEEEIERQFTQYPVGGILIMGNNVETPEQITELNSRIKEAGFAKTGLVPFICVDEEGGTVTRIAHKESFPVTDVGDMSEIGRTGDSVNAYQAGRTLGSYLEEYQFNVDFAPDADVVVNPENEVIGTRSFGSDAGLVSEMVVQEIKGLQEEHICAAVKHFPGHGATEEDSHKGFAYSRRTMEQIQECELLPFQAAIKEGTEFVMVGHISYPEIIGNDEPASLSQYMITDLLKNKMGYDGIVITDAMNMGAISQNYSSGEATVKAIEAGVDMILEPEDFQESYQAVMDAVKSEEISEKRINESAKRVLKVKRRLE